MPTQASSPPHRPAAWPSQHSTVLHPEGGLPTFFFLQGHSLGVVTSPWPWLGPPWPRGILGLGRLCRLSGHLMAHMVVLLPPAWSKSFTVGDGCVEGGGCPATVSIATLHALGRGCSPPLWAEVKVGSPTARRWEGSTSTPGLCEAFVSLCVLLSMVSHCTTR